MTTESLSHKYAISPEVIESRLGDELVLLHLGSGIYFGLDSLGTRIWNALKDKAPLTLLCEKIADEFTVPVAQVEEDIRTLLADLRSHEIILESA